MDLEQSNPEQPGAVGNEGVILQDGETESDDSEAPETKMTRCSIETSALPAVVSAAEYARLPHVQDVVAVPRSAIARPALGIKHRHDTRNPEEEEELRENKRALYNTRMRRLSKAYEDSEDCKRQPGSSKDKKRRLHCPKYKQTRETVAST